MLSIVLKILSILGILLLCFLGLAVFIILLVLFFPICYKISGKKDTNQLEMHIRASWLFGFLRVCFDYPDPGKFLVKLLFFTVFDSGKESGSKTEKASKGSSVKAAKKENRAGKHSKAEGEQGTAAAEGQKPTKLENGQNFTGKAKEGQILTEEGTREGQNPTGIGTAANKMPAEAGGGQAETAADKEHTSKKTQQERTDTSGNESGSLEPDQEIQEDSPLFFKKINKIKYTIRSIYDKIKNIWENISYYIELLKEKETKELFSHVVLRAGKVLKNIRPRHVKGQILFGTGSPDTTGYAYGIYGMLMPHLGGRLLVTPDFTQAVLEGDIYIAGHITVFTILWNGLRVLLDRKLKRFIQKIKAGRKM